MTGSRPFESHRSRRTGVNALIGGITSIVLAFLPFSPLIGGFVAGYLHDADRSAAIRVGALAGLVALIPLLFVGLVVFLFVGGGLAIAGAPRASIVFIFALFLGGTLALLYTVGLSAGGGYLGAIVAEDYVR